MTDTETTTHAVLDVAKQIPRAVAVAYAKSVLEVAGAVAILGTVGYAYQAVQKRRAKKASLTVVHS